ncbi:MAG: hypothetical protein ACPGSC_03245 [Granulosicoccaceae bacterium]
MVKKLEPHLRDFEDLLTQLMAEHGVEQGTMMGFPCMRINGDFFASANHQTGDLVVKLPAYRVAALIADGLGQPFAPAGRTFKEWVSFAQRDPDQWESLALEALEFVRSKQ